MFFARAGNTCAYTKWEVILDASVPAHHRIAVPAHPALRVGTLNSILRSVAYHKGVSREAILETI